MVTTDNSSIYAGGKNTVAVTGADTTMGIRTEPGSDWILPNDASLGISAGVIPAGTIFVFNLKLYEVRFMGGTVSFT